MHEVSLASSLRALVEEQVRAHAASRVLAVHVAVGVQAGVEPELLRGAWELVRAGGSCDQAEIRLSSVPVRWACPSCAGDAEPGRTLRCPRCGTALRLAQGDELVLERIELEVDHV
jgi:hydrogenase nickel incorporation protein HypA/HybF